jgi:hypothetical protein
MHSFRAEVRRAGKALVVWTVNAPHEWLECARWGVDAIITDRNADYRAWQRRLAGATARAAPRFTLFEDVHAQATSGS